MKDQLFSRILVSVLAPLMMAFTACSGGGGGGDADADMEVAPDPAEVEAQTDPRPDEDAPADVEPEAEVGDGMDVSDTMQEDAVTDPEPDARPCPDCDAGNACIMLDITRVPEEDYLPWILWPSEADGAGTLIIHAVRESTVLARATIEDADMTPVDARYTANLCVTPGTLQIIVFLDDNENAPIDRIYSADYRDTCMGPGECYRCIELTVSAGDDVAAEARLYGSCD